ncbi:diguanylate cyclase [Clostridiaceae bacterium UIB06]|uniref:Diguanylate cyclase n=1 Tax=Clostridium thailandense TaxID=2794346 RepID=A0A949TT28_9CLOT|nr:HD domain-containing phosphohydrolase [Clostridium thailandense]MBV7276002.1 diguanylate cyclase [Clostridium thailandense]MCH5138088.1 diguanylate cyclase [Clostridiaceae bacterium UIB06]
MFDLIRKKIYSLLKVSTQNKFKYECIKICMVYLITGFLWIYFSDRIASKIASNNKMLIIINTYKGWLYVTITSLIIYLLIDNLLKKVELAEKKLNTSYEELATVNEELEAYVQQLTASEEELRVQYDQIAENEKKLKQSEYNFKKIFEDSSDPIIILGDNKVIDCNLAAIEFLGCSSKKWIIGKEPWKLSPERQPDGENSKEKEAYIFEIASKNGKYKFEWWHKRIDGKSLPVEIMVTSILLNGKKVFHCLMRDISERKQMELRLEYLSYHDQLTGLYNRRFFEKKLKLMDKEINFPLTIIMADVNGLKLVNDSFGHAVGDDLLKKVVEVMLKGCRSNDIVARLSGDEFVILMSKTNAYEAEQIIERIKAIALNENVGSVEISVSFGYETKNNEEEKIQDILKKAEDHMYKKKLFESPSMRGKTIKAIIRTLHEKNKREEEHSHRVSMLCESMGRALSLPEDGIKELKTVGLLHDIGKIAIEENILNKPGKLTDEEWEEIRRHPEIGYRILSTVNDMAEMAEYVLYHHESYNGIGYPKGLKGEEIPLQSRIIAIADAYDAMVSERSYRRALSEEIAIKELTINAGVQFDLELVRIFVEKVLNKNFDNIKINDYNK